MESLNEIANDNDERLLTRNEANALKEKLSSLETTFMAILWYFTELGKIIIYYEFLCGFLQEVRKNCNCIHSAARDKCKKEHVADFRWKRNFPTYTVG